MRLWVISRRRRPRRGATSIKISSTRCERTRGPPCEFVSPALADVRVLRLPSACLIRLCTQLKKEGRAGGDTNPKRPPCSPQRRRCHRVESSSSCSDEAAGRFFMSCKQSSPRQLERFGVRLLFEPASAWSSDSGPLEPERTPAQSSELQSDHQNEVCREVGRLAGPKAASKPSSTKRRLRRSTVRSQIPSASATSVTLHRCPQRGPTSHNKRARACTNLWADVFPVRVSGSSLSRCSFVSVTLYPGTILYENPEMGFPILHPLCCRLLVSIFCRRLGVAG